MFADELEEDCSKEGGGDRSRVEAEEVSEVVTARGVREQEGGEFDVFSDEWEAGSWAWAVGSEAGSP